jgi:hypothetical protein
MFHYSPNSCFPLALLLNENDVLHILNKLHNVKSNEALIFHNWCIKVSALKKCTELLFSVNSGSGFCSYSVFLSHVFPFNYKWNWLNSITFCCVTCITQVFLFYFKMTFFNQALMLMLSTWTPGIFWLCLCFWREFPYVYGTLTMQLFLRLWTHYRFSDFYLWCSHQSSVS